MPQHQHQRNVRLTENGRSATSTRVHVLYTRYASDSLTPQLDATIRSALPTNDTDGSEVSEHELRLMSGTTVVGRLFWRRRITLANGGSANNPQRDLVPPQLVDPPGSGAPSSTGTTGPATWTALLDSAVVSGNPTWKFEVEVRSAGSSGWTVAITTALESKNAVHYRIEANNGAVSYVGRLMVSATTGDFQDPVFIAIRAPAQGRPVARRTKKVRG